MRPYPLHHLKAPRTYSVPIYHTEYGVPFYKLGDDGHSTEYGVLCISYPLCDLGDRYTSGPDHQGDTDPRLHRFLLLAVDMQSMSHARPLVLATHDVLATMQHFPHLLQLNRRRIRRDALDGLSKLQCNAGRG